jgi:FkbM family methyltransferase
LQVDTKYCIDDKQRDFQIEYASKNISGRIDTGPDRGEDSIAVVCFGPSLKTDWEKIKDYKYIITCSGAHKFLIDRGIIPNYHVDVDPRQHKIKLLGTPHKDVEYLLASTIHPEYVDLIKNYNVKLWHGYAGCDITTLPNVFPRNEWVFTGGCTVGLRALLIARFLGFKKMGLFGMDCSYPDDNLGEHADIHPNPCKSENLVSVLYEGVTYNTSIAMVEYARQFFKETVLLSDVTMAIYGNGLLQHMIYTGWKDKNIMTLNSEAVFAFKAPEVISKEYLKQNELLHKTNPYYGVSGSKYAEEVLKLAKELHTTDILDYGCGKGTLGKSLPFKIKEYDPAIEEKSNTPLPADLVVCTDVLEHVEPEYIDGVIGDIARCTKNTAFFIIHTGPALKTLPDGRNTHLIQEHKTYWDEMLKKYFTIKEIVEYGNNIRCIAESKIKNISSTLESADNQALSFDYVEKENVKYINVTQRVAWRIDTLRTKEPVTIEWLDSFVEEDIFVDVGANMGLYTLWAAVNKKTKTYAFEPESQNYALLNQNIFINQQNNRIKAYNLAITDKIGIGNFYITELMPGSSLHQFDSIVNYKGEPTEFIFEQGNFGVTLDYLVDNKMIPQPTHIKIDVDGLEHRVILGAIKTIQNVKSLLIEVNTNSKDHQKMIKILCAMGFYYDDNQVNRSLRKEGPFSGIGEYVFRRS